MLDLKTLSVSEKVEAATLQVRSIVVFSIQSFHADQDAWIEESITLDFSDAVRAVRGRLRPTRIQRIDLGYSSEPDRPIWIADEYRWSE